MEGEREFVSCAAFVLDNGLIAPISLFYPKNKYQCVSKFSLTEHFPPAAELGKSSIWLNLDMLPAIRVWVREMDPTMERVHQFSGGMLTPNLALSVDHGLLLPTSRSNKTLVSHAGDGSVPDCPPFTAFEIPSAEFYNTDVIPVSTYAFEANFPGLWQGIPEKMRNSKMELRFLKVDQNCAKFAIPCATPEGKFMVAAGYGGIIAPSRELRDFVTTYHSKSSTLTSPSEIEGLTKPSIFEVRNTFTRVSDRLAIAPCVHLKNYYQNAVFSINGSLTIGHCGSFLYDLENPSLFYGLYAGAIPTDTGPINFVWSTRDPVFVQGWIENALPYFLSDNCKALKSLQAIESYLVDVKDTVLKFSSTAITDVLAKIAKLKN